MVSKRRFVIAMAKDNGTTPRTSLESDLVSTSETTDMSSELAELSRIVLELASVVAGLLDAHETLGADQGHKLVHDARDVHHRLQARRYE